MSPLTERQLAEMRERQRKERETLSARGETPEGMSEKEARELGERVRERKKRMGSIPKGRAAPFRKGRIADDRTEEIVRARVSQALSAAGVDERRISQEALYLMPQDFVRKYRELHEACLKYGGERSAGSDGVSTDRAGSPGDESGSGVGKGSGLGKRTRLGSKSGLDQSTRHMRAKGGGKRWKDPAWIIKDERALEIKSRVDLRLSRIVEWIAEELRRMERGQDLSDTCLGCGRAMSTGKGRSNKRWIAEAEAKVRAELESEIRKRLSKELDRRDWVLDAGDDGSSSGRDAGEDPNGVTGSA